MAGRKKSGGGAPGETPIEALVHKETRKNIPTREQGELISDEEDTPEAMLYPRDPTLDPQLVWRGKDEQDRQALSVPVVPIYIQEKIEPKALIEDLRARSAGSKPQLDLFGAVAGRREFEEQIEFYQHDDKWTNRMILGDSLVVMTSLAQKENLKGKVQMIYMDPPYGIKFGSNWQVSTRKRDVADGKLEDLVRQPEQVKAFRDTWRLGIHSYLSYIRDRLCAAHNLLNETGSIFVQIGDENIHLVRGVLDEVFGSQNFCSLITISKTAGQTADLLAGVCDYLLWYAKDASRVKFHPVLLPKVDNAGVYRWTLLPDGSQHKTTPEEFENFDDLRKAGANIFCTGDLTSQRPPGDFPVQFQGIIHRPGKGYWKTGEIGMARLLLAGRVTKSASSLRYVRFIDDFPAIEIGNLWTDTGTGSFTDPKLYVVQTGNKIIERCLLMSTDPGDLVMDPTCGSGTTAYMAENWGRRWITCDTSRVALALARTRVMAARYSYYLLTDSVEGFRKQTELTGRTQPSTTIEGDIRGGFVCKRVPHVTLKSIANNEEIDTIHARYQEKLEPLRASLNKLLKQKWEEWEIPREATATWSAEAKAAHAEWWQLRRARQKEIDASIARRAESEVLYDQPYEDPKRIRVSGPFTVESLSPHRMLDTSIPQPKSAAAADQSVFVGTILDNLKKAGVQNTVKGERLQFERLNTFAGKWLQAEGEFTDKGGVTRRVAICIGPEHGTVSPELVRSAAKEALKPFDLLVVCGFAFDALAYEAAKEFAPKNGSVPPPATSPAKAGAAPKALTVLLSRMNPDLAMGDELLKKTGAGNLFMVFGEPDITLTKGKDGKLTVAIHGLDVYDPTTGQIRAHTTDEIACWFLDTDYNGESFFVRHAYFTGANDPYEKLKRALKAEIDEAAWSSLYTTTSRPFDAPKTGLIAVKVINHYGDEVLKVYKAP